MAAGIQVTVTGDERAANHLDEMGHRATHAEPAFREATKVILNAERALFRGGDGRWVKLKPATARRKGGKPTMVDTGKLRRSLTQPYANGAIREAHADYMEFGTAVSYARYHHEGRGVPKRPLLAYEAPQRRSVVRILLDHITGDR